METKPANRTIRPFNDIDNRPFPYFLMNDTIWSSTFENFSHSFYHAISFGLSHDERSSTKLCPQSRTITPSSRRITSGRIGCSRWLTANAPAWSLAGSRPFVNGPSRNDVHRRITWTTAAGSAFSRFGLAENAPSRQRQLTKIIQRHVNCSPSRFVCTRTQLPQVIFTNSHQT